MNKSVGIPVIPAVECFTTNFTLVGLLSSVYPPVLLEMLWVDEGGIADLALEGSLASVGSLDMVVE